MFGNNYPRTHNEKLVLIASEKTWIDGEALRQLEQTSELPGISLAVGLPDLHPGRGIPVGAAFVSQGIFYPHLVGNDVGCGMSLSITDLHRKKVKLDRIVKKLSHLEGPWQGDAEAWIAQNGLPASEHDASLGTIGGGNHFAELQAVEEVHDESAFGELGFSSESLTLLVHTGSRSLGESIWSNYVGDHGVKGIGDGSQAAQAYLFEHDRAVKWAEINRLLVTHRFLTALGTEGQTVLDLPHNMITKDPDGAWIHRKGAAPSDRGAVIIPGSRGTLSYLVAPIGNQSANANSLAHGAGRKWSRNQCEQRLRSRYSPEALSRTDLGGRVICGDRDLLYQEAPQAYKKIDTVIEDLIDAGLARVIATFRPLVTYKTRGIP